MMACTDYGCWFAVITIVPEAHKLWVAGVGEPAPVMQDGYPWTVAELPAADGGAHTVVEALQPERSNQPAQSFAARMLRVWRPRCLLIADIGGGIWGTGTTARDGLALGDVVIAEILHYYELQKLVPTDDGVGKRVPRYIRWQPTSPRLTTVARELDSLVDWRAHRTVTPPDPQTTPKLPLGELVCGDKLLTDADSAETKFIVSTYDKALAVDMETVGVALAALEANDDGLAISFAALRGISDWMDGPDNKQTRDDWKLAACDAAVATARGLIGVTPTEIVGIRREELDSVEELRRRLVGDYRVPADAYPSIVRTPNGTISRNDALTRAAARHGVALIGGAGLGKSTMLHQAAMATSSPLEPFPVLIDLKRWKSDWANALPEDPTGENLLPSMDGLLRASMQRIGISLLQDIVARRDVLLMVDGLNEVPFTEVASRILVLLDEYMRANPRARVLVADRHDGGFYAESGWETLRLDRLDADEVGRIVDERLGDGASARIGDAIDLLRIPFFLNRALTGGNLDLASRASALHSFFVEHLALGDEQLDRLASMAFDIYHERRQRTFAEADAREAIGEHAVTALRGAGALLGDSEDIVFGHQLEHDFLAARHLASDSHRWTVEILDAVTFKAASFDVPAMALELQDAETDRDAFVRALYDWNWRGTVTAMASAEQEGRPSASEHLRTAILAVAAEKRFDRVDGTRERANSQLARFDGELAAQMRSVDTVEGLTAEIASIASGPAWFSDWQQMFCRGTDLPLTEHEVQLLGSADALIGWTAANVVRRFAASADSSLQVRTIYATHQGPGPANRSARWRAVHALGVWPDDSNADLLLGALEDEYSWVIYGAVRSLMEMTAVADDPGLRDRILAELSGRFGDLPTEALSQVAWTPLYHGAPPGYAALIRPLLVEIIGRQHSTGERERWNTRLDRFDAFWAEQAVG